MTGFKVFFALAETNIRAAINILGWQHVGSRDFHDDAARVMNALAGRLGVRPKNAGHVSPAPRDARLALMRSYVEMMHRLNRLEKQQSGKIELRHNGTIYWVDPDNVETLKLMGARVVLPRYADVPPGCGKIAFVRDGLNEMRDAPRAVLENLFMDDPGLGRVIGEYFEVQRDIKAGNIDKYCF